MVIISAILFNLIRHENSVVIFYKIYVTKIDFDNISSQIILCMIILINKIPKKKKRKMIIFPFQVFCIIIMIFKY